MSRNYMLARLSALIITAFVDMVGLLMVVPLLPFYTRDLGGNGLMVTMLVSAYTAAQLLSAPLWGRVSDRYGRRPALMVGLTAAAIAYLVFAYATSFWLLLLSRIVQGAGGGTTGVVQAYVTDAVEPKDRAKALGWLSAATNLGVALGPPLGAVALLHFGTPGPGVIAALLCGINLIFAWRYLTESRDMVEARSTVRKAGASRDAIMHVITHPTQTAPRLIWMYAIAIGAFTGMNAILALFLNDQFGVDANHIWIFYTYIGVISVITRAGILGRAVDKYGEVALSRIGLSLLALGLISMPFTMHYATLAIAVALVPLGTAFTFPCVTAMLSRVIPSQQRGLFMGLQQTFGGVGRVTLPLIAGVTYDIARGIPFWTSAALVIGVLVLGMGIRLEVE